MKRTEYLTLNISIDAANEKYQMKDKDAYEGAKCEEKIIRYYAKVYRARQQYS